MTLSHAAIAPPRVRCAFHLVVEGAGHDEMYDEPRYVDQAIERLTAFDREHL